MTKDKIIVKGATFKSIDCIEDTASETIFSFTAIECTGENVLRSYPFTMGF